MRGAGRLFRPGFIYANAKSPPPLYQRDLNKPLTMESLDDYKAVYFGFHAVAENEGQSFADFIASLVKEMGDVTTTMAAALADGTLSEKERGQIIAEAKQAIDWLNKLITALSPDRRKGR